MNPITIQIDIESNVPVYRQIVDAIRALIVEERMKPGDRLPTVRALAVNLGIHHNTVAQAYRDLADEGWLDIGRRRGAIVTQRNKPVSTVENRRAFTKRLRELIAKAQADGLTSREIGVILNAQIAERNLSS